MISVWQLLLVFVILLLVFGPSRLEGLGSALGKAIKGFKKGVKEVESEGEKVIHIKKDQKSEEHSNS